MLKSMKQMSKQNLYFKGFPIDDVITLEQIENLESELTDYFSKFGEVKNLKLTRRDIHQQQDIKAYGAINAGQRLLIGFGFVSF